MCADNISENTTSSTLNASAEQVVGQTSTLASALAFSLLGIPPNLLSIVLIRHAKRRKSTTTYFLLNLAIADVVNLLVSLLITILQSTHDAKTPWTITLPSKAVANFTLAFIALERYNGLLKTMAPFVNMGKGRVKIILGVTWSVCIVFYMSVFAYEVINNGGTRTFVAIYYTGCILATYVFPLVVVGYCYGKILKNVSHAGGTILVQTLANETAMEEKNRFVRIMVVVAVVFMACNLPAVVVKIMITADHDISVNRGLWNTLMLLGCVSSAVNPYIYGLHSERYRKQVKELLCCEHSQTS